MSLRVIVNNTKKKKQEEQEIRELSKYLIEKFEWLARKRAAKKDHTIIVGDKPIRPIY
jgi:hypothetical protein